MNAAVDDFGLGSPMFHDVYFTACRPGGSSESLLLPISPRFLDVTAQGPNRRPGPRCHGQAGSTFHPTVTEGKFGIESGRGKGFEDPLLGMVLPSGHEIERTVGDVCVAG